MQWGLSGLSRPQRQLLTAAALAQLLSFLLCVTGSTAGMLAARGLAAPATQALLNYVLLGAACWPVHAWRTKLQGHNTLQPLVPPPARWLSNPWYAYLLLSVLDVGGNVVVTSAYKYTSITSVTLLDCFTVPAVMLLTTVVLNSRYRMKHVIGAVLCVLGLAVLVGSDVGSETSGPVPLLGDALVLIGACLYAACNVAQERLLVRGPCPASRWELLAMQGSFGVLLTGGLAVATERSVWASAAWDGPAVAALLGFAAALFVFSMCMPLVLIQGGSTMLNLSLLTSDLWAAAARGLFFGGFGGTGLEFAAALSLETIGICVYTSAGPATAAATPATAGQAKQAGAAAPDAEALDDEEDNNDDERPLLAGKLQPTPLAPLSTGGSPSSVLVNGIMDYPSSSSIASSFETTVGLDWSRKSRS